MNSSAPVIGGMTTFIPVKSVTGEISFLVRNQEPNNGNREQLYHVNRRHFALGNTTMEI